MPNCNGLAEARPEPEDVGQRSRVRGLGNEDDSFANFRSSLRARRERLARREEMLKTQETKGTPDSPAVVVCASSESGIPTMSSSGVEMSTVRGEVVSASAAAGLAGTACEHFGSGGEPSRPRLEEKGDSTALSLIQHSDIFCMDDNVSVPRSRGLCGENAATSALRRSLPARVKGREGRTWQPPESELTTRTRSSSREYAGISVGHIVNTGDRVTRLAAAFSSAADQVTTSHNINASRVQDLNVGLLVRQDLAKSAASAIPETADTSAAPSMSGVPEETREERIARYKEQRRKALATKAAEQLSQSTVAGSDEILASSSVSKTWRSTSQTSDAKLLSDAAVSEVVLVHSSVPERARAGDVTISTPLSQIRNRRQELARVSGSQQAASAVPEGSRDSASVVPRCTSSLGTREQHQGVSTDPATLVMLRQPADTTALSAGKSGDYSCSSMPVKHNVEHLGTHNGTSVTTAASGDCGNGVPSKSSQLHEEGLSPVAQHQADEVAVGVCSTLRGSTALQPPTEMASCAANMSKGAALEPAGLTILKGNSAVGSDQHTALPAAAEIGGTGTRDEHFGGLHKETRTSVNKDFVDNHPPVFPDVLKRFKPADSLLLLLGSPLSVAAQGQKTGQVESVTSRLAHLEQDEVRHINKNIPAIHAQVGSLTRKFEGQSTVTALTASAHTDEHPASSHEPSAVPKVAAVAGREPSAVLKMLPAARVHGNHTVLSENMSTPSLIADHCDNLKKTPVVSPSEASCICEKSCVNSEKSSMLTDDDRQSERSSTSSAICKQSVTTATDSSTAAASVAAVGVATTTTEGNDCSATEHDKREISAMAINSQLQAAMPISAQSTKNDATHHDGVDGSVGLPSSGVPKEYKTEPSHAMSKSVFRKDDVAALLNLAEKGNDTVAFANKSCERFPLTASSGHLQARVGLVAASPLAARSDRDSPLDPQLAMLLQARLKRVSDSAGGAGAPILSENAVQQAKDDPSVGGTGAAEMADRSAHCVADKVSFFVKEQLRHAGLDSVADGASAALEHAQPGLGRDRVPAAEPSSGAVPLAKSRREKLSKRERSQTQPVTCDEVLAAQNLSDSNNNSNNNNICNGSDVVEECCLDKVSSLAVMTLDEKIRLFIESSVVTPSSIEAEAHNAPASGARSVKQARAAGMMAHKLGRQHRFLTQPLTTNEVREVLSSRLPQASGADILPLCHNIVQKIESSLGLADGADQTSASDEPRKTGCCAVLVEAGSLSATAMSTVVVSATAAGEADEGRRLGVGSAPRPRRRVGVAGAHAQQLSSNAATASGTSKATVVNGSGGHSSLKPTAVRRTSSEVERHANSVTAVRQTEKKLLSQAGKDAVTTLPANAATPSNSGASHKLHRQLQGTPLSVAEGIPVQGVCPADIHVTVEVAEPLESLTTKRRVARSASHNAHVVPSYKEQREGTKDNVNSSSLAAEAFQSDSALPQAVVRNSARPERSRVRKSLTLSSLSTDAPSYMRATQSYASHLEPARPSNQGHGVFEDAQEVTGSKTKRALEKSVSHSSASEGGHDGDLPSYMRATNSFAHKVEHLLESLSDSEERPANVPAKELETGAARLTRKPSLSLGQHHSDGGSSGDVPSYMRPTKAAVLKDVAHGHLGSTSQSEVGALPEGTAVPPTSTTLPRRPRSTTAGMDGDELPSYMRATASYASKVEHLLETEENDSGLHAKQEVIVKARRSSVLRSASGGGLEVAVQLPSEHSCERPSFMRTTANYAHHSALKETPDKKQEEVKVRSLARSQSHREGDSRRKHLSSVFHGSFVQADVPANAAAGEMRLIQVESQGAACPVLLDECGLGMSADGEHEMGASQGDVGDSSATNFDSDTVNCASGAPALTAVKSQQPVTSATAVKAKKHTGAPSFMRSTQSSAKKDRHGHDEAPSESGPVALSAGGEKESAAFTHEQHNATGKQHTVVRQRKSKGHLGSSESLASATSSSRQDSRRLSTTAPAAAATEAIFPSRAEPTASSTSDKADRKTGSEVATGSVEHGKAEEILHSSTVSAGEPVPLACTPACVPLACTPACVPLACTPACVLDEKAVVPDASGTETASSAPTIMEGNVDEISKMSIAERSPPESDHPATI